MIFFKKMKQRKYLIPLLCYYKDSFSRALNSVKRLNRHLKSRSNETMMRGWTKWSSEVIFNHYHSVYNTWNYFYAVDCSSLLCRDSWIDMRRKLLLSWVGLDSDPPFFTLHRRKKVIFYNWEISYVCFIHLVHLHVENQVCYPYNLWIDWSELKTEHFFLYVKIW